MQNTATRACLLLLLLLSSCRAGRHVFYFAPGPGEVPSAAPKPANSVAASSALLQHQAANGASSALLPRQRSGLRQSHADSYPEGRTLSQQPGHYQSIRIARTCRPALQGLAARPAGPQRALHATIPQYRPKLVSQNAARLPSQQSLSRGTWLEILGWVFAIGGIALGIWLGGWLGLLVALVLVAAGALVGLFGTFVNGNLP